MDTTLTTATTAPPYFRLSPFISILLVILQVVGWIAAVGTTYTYLQIDYIRSHWNEEKCKPAGLFIGGKENLRECVKPIIGGVVSQATSPLAYGTLALTNVFVDLTKGVQQLRMMFDYIRVSLANITRDVFGRIVNLMIPLQSMFITVKDMFARMYAVFATSIYMGLATILTMKKVLEMLLTFVIVILISLAALIIMMWILPFSWAVAAAFTAIFVSISIPLAKFVAQVGKVTDLGIPRIPAKPHVCFDKYTKISCECGVTKPIYKIKVGDVLADGSIVTAKLKLARGDSVMYLLNGVMVTGTHVVKYKHTWIPVSTHPQSVRVLNYKRDTIYCINTTSGVIKMSYDVYTDWNEMLPDDFTYNQENTSVKLKSGQILPIQCILLGDVLDNGEVVTGIVKTLYTGEPLHRLDRKIKYYHLYTKIII
jgi:hypothetical protein